MPSVRGVKVARILGTFMHLGDSCPLSTAPTVWNLNETGAGEGRDALSLLALQAVAEPRVTPLQRAPPSALQREKPFLVTHSKQGPVLWPAGAA